MLSLYDRASIQHALERDLDHRLHKLLSERVNALASPAGDLTELTHFLVIQPGDDEQDIIEEVGFSPLTDPIDGNRFPADTFHPWWDWLRDHGGWFEMIVTISNSGFAFVLLIEDAPGVDPYLLALCRSYAGSVSCR